MRPIRKLLKRREPKDHSGEAYDIDNVVNLVIQSGVEKDGLQNIIVPHWIIFSHEDGSFEEKFPTREGQPVDRLSIFDDVRLGDRHQWGCSYGASVHDDNLWFVDPVRCRYDPIRNVLEVKY